VIAGGGLLALPWIADEIACRSTRAQIADLAAITEVRIERLSRDGHAADAGDEVLVDLLDAVHAGPSLTAVLRRITELATSGALPPPQFAVAPPVHVDREMEGVPTPWLREHSVRLVLPGPPAKLWTFADQLARAALPIRLEAIALRAVAGRPDGAALEADVRVLIGNARVDRS
jgi:hypothetical protein